MLKFQDILIKINFVKVTRDHIIIKMQSIIISYKNLNKKLDQNSVICQPFYTHTHTHTHLPHPITEWTLCDIIR